MPETKGQPSEGPPPVGPVYREKAVELIVDRANQPYVEQTVAERNPGVPVLGYEEDEKEGAPKMSPGSGEENLRLGADPTVEGNPSSPAPDEGKQQPMQDPKPAESPPGSQKVLDEMDRMKRRQPAEPAEPAKPADRPHSEQPKR